MDPNATTTEREPSLLRMLDAALQIGLVALLIFACSRIILPFTGILLWSVILAVMLYPLHQRLVVRVGNRWSATLIGLVSVALMLVPLVMVVTSLGSSILEFVSGLQDGSLTVPPPPPRLADLPLIGHKLTDDMGARSNKHAGGACEVWPAAKWDCSMAGVVRGRFGRRSIVVRTFVRSRCRAHRL